MRFTELAVAGAFRIDPDPIADERGLFARTFCAREFAARGLATAFAQASLSWNARRGTLRGLHYQEPPHAEAKLVRVTRGRVFDVGVDLRRDSPSFLEHAALELSAAARHQVYWPPGVAHGFLTLEDDCELAYLISSFHEPTAARGVRWNDPAFAIAWPAPVEVLSERDATYPDFVR